MENENKSFIQKKVINTDIKKIETLGLHGVPYWPVNDPKYFKQEWVNIRNEDGEVVKLKQIIPKRYVVLASTGKGKTALLAYLLKHVFWRSKHFDRFVLISPSVNSPANIKNWAWLPPNTKIIDRWSEQAIYDEMDTLDKYYKETGHMPSTLLYIDDNMSYKTQYSPALGDLWTRGRHYCITPVYMCQSINLVHASALKNNDFLILLKMKGKTHLIFENMINTNIMDYTKDEGKKVESIVKKVINTPYTAFIVDQDRDMFYVYKIPKKAETKYIKDLCK